MKEQTLIPEKIKPAQIQENSLTQHLQNHIIDGKAYFQRSKLGIILCFILLTLGAAWGLPWLQSAANAAIVFPEGPLRENFATLFKWGIAITVGADGLWVMLAAIAKTNPLPECLKNAKKKSNTLKYQLLASALSIASVIAPVWSVFKYNTQTVKIFILITLTGKLGYSFFGYLTLINQSSLFWQNRKKTQKGKTLKKSLLENLENLRKNPSLLTDIENGKSFAQYLLNPNTQASISTTTSAQKLKSKKKIQASLALFIALFAFTLDTFLIGEFLEHTFSIPPLLSLPFACMIAIPTLVVLSIAAYNSLGDWLNIFWLKIGSDSTFENYYPKSYKLSSFAAFLTALLAPTAAAYIAYTTLSGKLHVFFVWVAVFAMISGRTLFAYFSLTRLSAKFALLITKKTNPKKAKEMAASIRIEKFMQQVKTLSEEECEALKG